MKLPVFFKINYRTKNYVKKYFKLYIFIIYIMKYFKFGNEMKLRKKCRKYQPNL